MSKRFVKAMDVPPRVIQEGRLSRMLVSKSSVGVTSFSMGLHTCEPGLPTRPPHVHDRESETMYVIEGRARFFIGDEDFICEADSMVHAPAGVPHGYEILGDRPLKFIWIYTPPLPEQK